MKLSRSVQHPVTNLFADFDQLFQRAVQGTLFTGGQPADPGLGVYEEDSAWHLRTDLPGFRKEDLNLRVEDGVLYLEARRDDSERTFRAQVERSLKLPDNVDPAGIKARLENGVLEVTLPKVAPAEPEALRIEIQ